MISPKEFHKELNCHDINFFCGVPDSLLKDFCMFLEEQKSKHNHIITANEGNAIALASGYHFATNQVAAVYLQNSGLGNAVNPLLSLTDKEVCKVPMLLIIGWRGQPGVHDEPQHKRQGEVTQELLHTLNIPYKTISPNSDYKDILNNIIEEIKEKNTPGAILVPKNCFEKYSSNKPIAPNGIIREQALERIITLSTDSDIIISTTGKTSRELFEIRKNQDAKFSDFLTVGSMGHSSSIALGIAISQPDKRVICIDGDGALLMHMGATAIIGDISPPNLVHIVLNNGVHESVGGHKTSAKNINFELFSISLGYKSYFRAKSLSDLDTIWSEVSENVGPVFIEIDTKVGSRSDLSRPSFSPEENKINLMKHIQYHANK